jgi:hypothetical protein
VSPSEKIPLPPSRVSGVKIVVAGVLQPLYRKGWAIIVIYSEPFLSVPKVRTVPLAVIVA